MADRITGRLNDGTVFIHSETGNEGVGHFTTQRRLPEIICKLARFEDKIESGELVEVVHGEWISEFGSYCTPRCSACGWHKPYTEDYYCAQELYSPWNYARTAVQKCMEKGADNAEQN